MVDVPPFKIKKSLVGHSAQRRFRYIKVAGLSFSYTTVLNFNIFLYLFSLESQISFKWCGIPKPGRSSSGFLNHLCRDLSRFLHQLLTARLTSHDLGNSTNILYTDSRCLSQIFSLDFPATFWYIIFVDRQSPCPAPPAVCSTNFLTPPVLGNIPK